MGEGAGQACWRATPPSLPAPPTSFRRRGGQRLRGAPRMRASWAPASLSTRLLSTSAKHPGFNPPSRCRDTCRA
eukprot:1156303-Pelagomonas_calceolata.AAC.7